MIGQFFLCPMGSYQVSGYLGLEFQNKGQTHCGWALVSIAAVFNGRTGSMETKLSGFAYETIPGAAIKTGQTSGADEDRLWVLNRQAGMISAPTLSLATSSTRDSSLTLMSEPLLPFSRALAPCPTHLAKTQYRSRHHCPPALAPNLLMTLGSVKSESKCQKLGAQAPKGHAAFETKPRKTTGRCQIPS